jgi:hypothetical protein
MLSTSFKLPWIHLTNFSSDTPNIPAACLEILRLCPNLTSCRFKLYNRSVQPQLFPYNIVDSSTFVSPLSLTSTLSLTAWHYPLSVQFASIRCMLLCPTSHGHPFSIFYGDFFAHLKNSHGTSTPPAYNRPTYNILYNALNTCQTSKGFKSSLVQVLFAGVPAVSYPRRTR